MLADLLTRAVGVDGLKAAKYDTTTGRLWTRWARGGKYKGRAIDEADALGLPPFWRGFNLICSAIAGTPLHAYRDNTRLARQPAWITDPNPPETRFDTLFRLVGSAILRGNGVAVLGFDRVGWPNVMVPADARNVAAGRSPDGTLWYRIGNTVYDQSQILHVRGPVIGDQIGGVGVIEAHRLGLSLSATLESYAGSYFESGGTPSGVVEWGGAQADPAELDTFKREWVERFSGSLEPAVVPAGTKFTPIVGHAQEAQLIEARTFSLTTSALILGLDPEWLGAPGSARTYQNLSGRDTSLMKWSLAPWFDRLDQAFSSNLMTPRPQYVRFNRDAVARSSQLERLQAYKLGLDMGLYLLDELREWEDLPALPEPPPTPDPPALPPAPAADPATDGGTPDDSAQ